LFSTPYQFLHAPNIFWNFIFVLGYFIWKLWDSGKLIRTIFVWSFMGSFGGVKVVVSSDDLQNYSGVRWKCTHPENVIRNSAEGEKWFLGRVKYQPRKQMRWNMHNFSEKWSSKLLKMCSSIMVPESRCGVVSGERNPKKYKYAFRKDHSGNMFEIFISHCICNSYLSASLTSISFHLHSFWVCFTLFLEFVLFWVCFTLFLEFVFCWENFMNVDLRV